MTVRPLQVTIRKEAVWKEYEHARDGPPFRLLLLLLGTIENLQERSYPGAHSAVQIGLTALDVIMEIVTEELDV
jgi:hypothetical protein